MKLSAITDLAAIGRWTPSRRLLVANIVYVYLGYALRFISPLVVIPLLARRLGPSGYGLVLIGGALGLFVTLVVEFGFPNAGAREVATTPRGQALSRIVAAVTAAKAMLIAPAAVVALAATLIVPELRHHPAYGAGGFLVGVAAAANVGWYLQGRERMRVSVLLDLIGSLAYALLVVALVRTSRDGLAALFAQAAGLAVSAVIGHLIVLRETPFIRIRVSDVAAMLRTATALFLARAAVSLYTSASVLLIGVLSAASQVSFYAAGEKLVIVLIASLYPLGQAVFPRVARGFAGEGASSSYAIVRLMLIANGGFGLLVSLSISLLAPLIIAVLYGAHFAAAHWPFVILAWMMPFAAWNQVLGSQLLIPHRRDASVTHAVLAGGVANLCLAVLLTSRFGAMGMAVSRTASEIVVCLLYLAGAQRHGLLAPLLRRAPRP